MPLGLDTQPTSYWSRPRGLNDQPPGAVIVGAPRKAICDAGAGGGAGAGCGSSVVIVASWTWGGCAAAAAWVPSTSAIRDRRDSTSARSARSSAKISACEPLSCACAGTKATSALAASNGAANFRIICPP
jgi:hypothetical protein